MARSVLSRKARRGIARALGLEGFNVALAVGRRLPSWRVQLIIPPTLLAGSGINVIGDLKSDSGVGQVTRSMVGAMQAVGIPVAYTELVYSHLPRRSNVPPGIPMGAPYYINLIDIHFSKFHDSIANAPCDVFAGRYQIALWGWELAKFPELPSATYDLIDEIWTYSNFSLSSISAASPVPVVRVPPAVDVSGNIAASRSDFGLPADRSMFVFSFSPASSVARKNPFAVISAFERAFGKSNSGPILVIKTHHLGYTDGDKELAGDLKARMDEVGGYLISENLSREETLALYSMCSCYVSLHRTEGFGLGMAEAMALGKPVVATYYSGNTDFMSPSNSYCVRWSLRAITPSDHRYQPQFASLFPPGEVWAEPDIDHAAELMNFVFENPTEAATVGLRGKDDVERKLGSAAVGRTIQIQIARIRASRQ